MTAPLVLLVDDHDDTRGMYALALRLSGSEVLEAANGTEALARALERSPSVIVSDLRPHGSISTVDLCRHFRGKGVPIIALSGVDPGSEHEQIRAAGCVVILLKPVLPDALVSEVHRVLSESSDAD